MIDWTNRLKGSLGISLEMLVYSGYSSTKKLHIIEYQIERGQLWKNEREEISEVIY